jgi:hypothetical protein
MEKYKFEIGDVVIWTNENGVYLGPRTIINRVMIDGKARYYLDPIDTPWFAVSEKNLTAAPERG